MDAMPQESLSPSPPLNGERIRVLAIDDSDEFRDLIIDFLEPNGFEVVGIANPVKALERFRIEKDAFQLDPEWLKKMSPSIKVIIVSGAEELRLRQILAQHHFDGCIRKPFDLRIALQIIRNVMNNEKQHGLNVGF
jgi:CheY-like chemotaxis protein